MIPAVTLARLSCAYSAANSLSTLESASCSSPAVLMCTGFSLRAPRWANAGAANRSNQHAVLRLRNILMTSECQFQCELSDARWIVAGEHAEASGVDVERGGRRSLERGMVQNVKKFRPELE